MTAVLALDKNAALPMDAFVRRLIQLRLEDGRLPRGPVADVVEWALAEAHACDGCGGIIVKHQKAVSALGIDDWREVRMHRECFDVWETERVKSPEP